ncbi:MULTISPECIES: glycosyltransferase family 1 protein [Mycobacterium]|uniref:Glycosyltransferase family 1 protein n=1 Tax=Mycobacterium colombiense TaxID=339268 RepID=A0A329MHI8_9MYCO|nr:MULTISPECIES: glycosyltransferase family 1 protein [Mycobacterium]MDM4139899.1 glycosyltransferase family 1 protein [Mycobacterium sp. FLAC0960]RAV16867.1 glycosyltransferase family 1 protein [Mycobacterium colombiense]
MPASHVYVRHLGDPSADSVVRLDDPVPADGRTVPGGWWPPLMLEPGWVSENHSRFDVFHVHFGFDAIGPEVLTGVVHELKVHEKPLVYTVHDLRNPHHPEPQAHTAQQDVLIAAADELITLTPGAAELIRHNWARRVRVLPHPHVLERDWIEKPRARSEQFIVGIHAKSLRANMDPLPLVQALTEILSSLPDAILQVDLHDEIFDSDNHWFAPKTGAALLSYDRHEHVRVRVHPYFSDDELWEYLSSLTVSVLPYRFGTHSGWLEAGYDLGTAVLAPSCGFYHQQRPCGVFGYSDEGFDQASLCHAIHRAYARWAAGDPAPRAGWVDRLTERRELAAAHRAIYRGVLK